MRNFFNYELLTKLHIDDNSSDIIVSAVIQRGLN